MNCSIGVIVNTIFVNLICLRPKSFSTILLWLLGGALDSWLCRSVCTRNGFCNLANYFPHNAGNFAFTIRRQICFDDRGLIPCII